MDKQAFNCIWPLAGTCCFVELVSRDVHQLFSFILQRVTRVHTESAGKVHADLDHLVTRKLCIFIALEEACQFLSDQLSPEYQLCTRHGEVFHSVTFPLERSNINPFSPLSSACRYGLYIKSNMLFDKLPVGFCCKIVRNRLMLDRERNSR